jgi:hypothetical protein
MRLSLNTNMKLISTLRYNKCLKIQGCINVTFLYADFSFWNLNSGP